MSLELPVPQPEQMSALLNRWRDGDASALDALIELCYPAFRRLASQCARDEKKPVGTTSLVHETVLSLIEIGEVRAENQKSFFALIAQLMRRVLVDRARSAQTLKRGNGREPDPLREEDLVFEESKDLLAFDEALELLRLRDERQASIVSLTYFVGLDPKRISEVEGISVRTVQRELQQARAWLRARLEQLP